MQTLKTFLSEELNIKSEDIFEYFLSYNKYILEWNSKVNLISRQMKSIESNVLNSIFFLKKFDLSKYKKIIDIGTGGGFPGVPLAILYPGIEFVLADSIRKKNNALSDIMGKLNLKNTNTIWGRAEEISKLKNHRNRYDLVISKSVSTLYNLFIWGKNFLNKKGAILCIKGGDLQKEFDELKKIKGISCEEIGFQFREYYKIENKRIVIIKLIN
ncbi:MAG TPA: 16S rRNA (guanine(527)-N(7))-methyltransferase RsmG [Ignavibacteria bacterium]